MVNEPQGQLVPVGGGDVIPLIRERMTIGRRETCDIPLRFPNVSSLHAELTFRDGYWFIRDLNSTNGVKVNGTRVTQKVLLPGDEISIAKRRFTIHYTLAAGRRALEEIMEEDVMAQSLLERAGPARRATKRSAAGPASRCRRSTGPRNSGGRSRRVGAASQAAPAWKPATRPLGVAVVTRVTGWEHLFGHTPIRTATNGCHLPSLGQLAGNSSLAKARRRAYRGGISPERRMLPCPHSKAPRT
jgi:adenylate cyclase